MTTQSNNHKRKLHIMCKRSPPGQQEIRETMVLSRKSGEGGEPWVTNWVAVLERPGRAHHAPMPLCPSCTPLEPTGRQLWPVPVTAQVWGWASKAGLGPTGYQRERWVSHTKDTRLPLSHSIIDRTRSPLKTESVSRLVVSDSSQPHEL